MTTAVNEPDDDDALTDETIQMMAYHLRVENAVRDALGVAYLFVGDMAGAVRLVRSLVNPVATKLGAEIDATSVKPPVVKSTPTG